MFLSDAEPTPPPRMPVALTYSVMTVVLAVPVVFLGMYWGPLQALAEKILAAAEVISGSCNPLRSFVFQWGRTE